MFSFGMVGLYQFGLAFKNPTGVKHSNTKLVRYSNPHTDSANNSTLPHYLKKNLPIRKIFVYEPMKKDPELFD